MWWGIVSCVFLSSLFSDSLNPAGLPTWEKQTYFPTKRLGRSPTAAALWWAENARGNPTYRSCLFLPNYFCMIFLQVGAFFPEKWNLPPLSRRLCVCVDSFGIFIQSNMQPDMTRSLSLCSIIRHRTIPFPPVILTHGHAPIIMLPSLRCFSLVRVW